MFVIYLIFSLVSSLVLGFLLMFVVLFMGFPANDETMIATFVVSAIISFIYWGTACMGFDDNIEKELIDVDEQIPIKDLIENRDILNSINFETATKSEIYRALNKIGANSPKQLEIMKRTVDFQVLKQGMIEERDKLNSMDLESMKSMSIRELNKDKLTDEQLEKAQNDSNQELIDYVQGTSYQDTQDSDYDNNVGDIIGGAILSAFVGDSKQERIKKKRKIVEELDREHKFQRGYLPYWDSEEHLYENESDEERYLDGKITELRDKNLSHDMYLSEEEKEIYGDDMDGGMW